MINYKKGKTQYKINELGSLYVDESKVSNNEQPIIYIGGQMSHHGHVLEQSGFTADLNHNNYTGSWMFDYPVVNYDKSQVNAKNLSNNLLGAIKEAKLNNVILLAHSYGGLIGAYASKSEIVSKVISIHSPVLGTPLANYDYLIKYKRLLTKSQKLILTIIKYWLDYDYGFVQENFNGIDLRKVDLNKFIAVGNYLSYAEEKNRILLETYSIIEKVTGMRSDGIVPFETKEFDKHGINYIKSDSNTNHFDSAKPSYFEENLKKVLNK